jgi:hypothetical protein
MITSLERLRGIEEQLTISAPESVTLEHSRHISIDLLQRQSPKESWTSIPNTGVW